MSFTRSHEPGSQPVPVIPSSTRFMVSSEEEISHWQPAVPRLRLFHPAAPRPFSAAPSSNGHNIPTGTVAIASPGSHRPASAAISWSPATYLEQDRPASASPTQSRSAHILNKVHALQARAAASAMPPYQVHSLDSGVLIPGAGGPPAAASPNSRSDSPLFVVRRLVSHTGQQHPNAPTTGSIPGCNPGYTTSTSSPIQTAHKSLAAPHSSARAGSSRAGRSNPPLDPAVSGGGGSDDGCHTRPRVTTPRGRRSTMPDPTHLRIGSQSDMLVLPTHRSMDARLSTCSGGGSMGGSALAPCVHIDGSPPSVAMSSLSLVRHGPNSAIVIAASPSTADSLPPSVAASSWSLVRLQQHPPPRSGGSRGFAHRRSSTDVGGMPGGIESEGGVCGGGHVRASSSCGGAPAGGDVGGSGMLLSGAGDFAVVGEEQHIDVVLGDGEVPYSDSKVIKGDTRQINDGNGNGGGCSVTRDADLGGVSYGTIGAPVGDGVSEEPPSAPFHAREGGTGEGAEDPVGGTSNASSAFITALDGTFGAAPVSASGSTSAGWCADEADSVANAGDGPPNALPAADAASLDSYPAHAAAATTAPKPPRTAAAPVPGSISWPAGSPTPDPLLIAALSGGHNTPGLHPLRTAGPSSLGGAAAPSHSSLFMAQQLSGGGATARPTRPYSSSTTTKRGIALTPRAASSAALTPRPQSSNGGGGASPFASSAAIALGALRPTSARPRAGSAVHSSISVTAAGAGGASDGSAGGDALTAPTQSTPATASVGASAALPSAVLTSAALYEIMPDQQATVALTAGAAVPSSGRLGRALADILPTGNPGTFSRSLRERIAMVLKEGPSGPKPAPQRPEEPAPNPAVIKMLQDRQDVEAQRNAVDCAFSSGNPAVWMHQILAAEERAAGGGGGGGSGTGSGTITVGTSNAGGSVWSSSHHSGGGSLAAAAAHQQHARRYQAAAAAAAAGGPGTIPHQHHQHQHQQQQGHHLTSGAGGRRESPKQQHPRSSTGGGCGGGGGGGGGSWLVGSSCHSPPLQSPMHQSMANSRTATGSGSGGGGTSTGSPKRNVMIRHTSAEVLHLQSLSYLASKEACRTLAADSRVAPGISLRLTALGDGDHGALYRLRRSTGGAGSPSQPSSSLGPSAAAARMGRK